MTDQDAYWAAKIVMSFTEKEIRAIVGTGQLSDPEAEDYLVETLLARRDKIRAGLAATTVSSFDDFEWTASGELRFQHLASYYDFVRKPEYQISWFSFDNSHRTRQPIAEFQPGQPGGYYVAVVSSSEGKVEVYVRVADSEPQIIGIERL